MAVDRQETDWPRRIPSEICPGRPAPARSKTWEPELGRPGRPGRTSIFSWVGAGGTHLSGSAAQSDPLPTLAQPAQPAHALVVLAPPKPDPDLLSLSSSLAPAPAALPTSLSACLPACCFCPVPAPAPAKLAISKRTDDVLSDLPLPHPQNSILWRLAYTLTLTHSRHTHTKQHIDDHDDLPTPSDRLLFQTSQARIHISPAPDATAPLDLVGCPRQCSQPPRPVDYCLTSNADAIRPSRYPLNPSLDSLPISTTKPLPPPPHHHHTALTSTYHALPCLRTSPTSIDSSGRASKPQSSIPDSQNRLPPDFISLCCNVDQAGPDSDPDSVRPWARSSTTRLSFPTPFGFADHHRSFSILFSTPNTCPVRDAIVPQ